MAPPNPQHLETLYRAILDTACLCLDDTTMGVPANCNLYLSEPPADCCDTLALYTRFIRPARGFADAQMVSGVAMSDSCGDVLQVADIALRLYRPCWPALRNDPNNPFPSSEQMDEATGLLLEDAYVLQCCLKEAFAGGISIDGVGECLEIAWGDMLPHPPNGGCAGWTWYMTIEVG